MIRVRLLAASLLLAAILGCSGMSYAPVSGVVKLNGEPYPNAVVSFQPLGSADNTAPGRVSSAYTDENAASSSRPITIRTARWSANTSSAL